MLDALAIQRIRQVKGQMKADDLSSLEEKASSYLHQLVDIQLAEDHYGPVVSRELIILLHEFVEICSNMPVSVAYVIDNFLHDAMEAHLPLWSKEEVDRASQVAAALIHSSRPLKERRLIIQRGYSFVKDLIKGIRSHFGSKDARLGFPNELILEEPRPRGRPRRGVALVESDCIDGDDEDMIDGEEDAERRYLDLMRRLTKTHDPKTEFTLEDQILKLGFEF